MTSPALDTGSSRADTTVLVTGATGFIAQHVIIQLLDAGYTVRGTARSTSRDGTVRDAIRPALADATSLGRYSTVAADLTSDAGWADAVRGCRFVQHVASPIPSAPPKDENELIAPARDGALRVLRAAAAAGVERVVLTSSVAAVLYGVPRNKIFTESDWSNPNGKTIGAYEKSKTIAERAAWDFMATPAAGSMQLTTINPGLVMGPILSADFSTSGELVKKLLERDFPACPDINYSVVDVRDVAAAHVTAMTTAAASGQRYICAITNHSMHDVAVVLDKNYSAKGFKVPTGTLPSLLMRAVALFDKTARLALNDLGVRQDIDNSKIVRDLHWQPRTLEEMVTSMADSMIAHGVVKPKK
jgi:dihydroflavonol-4-reductase